jgi:quinol monooxygenase YgiN
MPLHVTVIYTAQPGKSDELERHLRAMLTPTSAEPGCLNYQLFRSDSEQDAFALLESYESNQAFESQKASEHFARHVKDGAWNVIASRTAVVGHEIDPDQE